MIFDKVAKTIHWGQDSSANKWWQENWISTHKRMKLDLFIISYTKINYK
jgi:hypothetical protein